MKKRVLQLLFCMSLVAPALFGANVQGGQTKPSVDKLLCDLREAPQKPLKKANAQTTESSGINKAIGAH